MRSALLIFLIGLFVIPSSATRAEKRVALIVGISRYQQVPQLGNPVRDSEAMAALFKRAGFDVVDNQRDLGVAELRRALRQFSEVSRDADIAVVYYAGHGIEVDGINYLIPADAKLLSDFDLEDETVQLDRVLRSLESAKRLKLIILDACRDNPFAKTIKRTLASRSIGRGLAEVEPIGADMLIAFAAKAGAVASDGDAENSPFATALLNHLTEPGLDLRIALGRVRDDVLKLTGHRQEPFVYGSLGGNTMALVPQQARPVDPDAEARVDYELAAQVGTNEAWDSFLARHNTGMLAELARAQSAKLSNAQRLREKADDARRQAEVQAAEKIAEIRRQIEERSAREMAEVKRKLSEQTKQDLEETRRQLEDNARKQLEEARRQIEVAQQQADAARQQIEDAKRQAIAEARRQVEEAKQAAKIASLAPNPSIPSEPQQPPAQMDPADVARLLQAHLKRVGCNSGGADGNWDDGSRNALKLFNKYAHTSFGVQVASLDALDAVRARTDRICPLVCGKGQRVDGDRCVEIGCGSGFFLNSNGACEKRPRAAEQREHRSRVAPSGGGRCFSFQGRSYCE